MNPVLLDCCRYECKENVNVRENVFHSSNNDATDNMCSQDRNTTEEIIVQEMLNENFPNSEVETDGKFENSEETPSNVVLNVSPKVSACNENRMIRRGSDSVKSTCKFRTNSNIRDPYNFDGINIGDDAFCSTELDSACSILWNILILLTTLLLTILSKAGIKVESATLWITQGTWKTEMSKIKNMLGKTCSKIIIGIPKIFVVEEKKKMRLWLGNNNVACITMQSRVYKIMTEVFSVIMGAFILGSILIFLLLIFIPLLSLFFIGAFYFLSVCFGILLMGTCGALSLLAATISLGFARFLVLKFHEAFHHNRHRLFHPLIRVIRASSFYKEYMEKINPEFNCDNF